MQYFPSPEKIGQLPPYTPDLPLLENKPAHILFGYGPLLDLPVVSSGYTLNRMGMWCKRQNGDGIGAVTLGGCRNHRAQVAGNLYRAEVADIRKLDKQHLNGVLFQRKRVEVIVPGFKTAHHQPLIVSALVYMGRHCQWAKHIAWDTTFYKGTGEFAKSELVQETADLRKFGINSYFHYLPHTIPQGRLTCHIRTSVTQARINVEDSDRQFLAEKEPKTEEPSRPVVYITSTNEPSTPSKVTLPPMSIF